MSKALFIRSRTSHCTCLYRSRIGISDGKRSHDVTLWPLNQNSMLTAPLNSQATRTFMPISPIFACRASSRSCSMIWCAVCGHSTGRTSLPSQGISHIMCIGRIPGHTWSLYVSALPCILCRFRRRSFYNTHKSTNTEITKATTGSNIADPSPASSSILMVLPPY